jgi:H+/Na+-translocating ferredoxin:NAD+ oxidoreductase subunit G
MSRKMPDWVKFPLVLVVVAGISAATLTGAKRLTDPYKNESEAKKTEAALKVVMPSATSFEKRTAKYKGSPVSYRVALRGGETVGYIAEGRASGYSSILRVMIGVDNEFVIKGIKVLYQKETPGLGDKVEEIRSKKTWGTIIMNDSPDEKGLRPWFQVQFDGMMTPVKVKKNGGDIEAITGATISSRAVCNAVNIAVAELKAVVAK